MKAQPAPEPRDVIWENVYIGEESVLRRQWIVNSGIVCLMLFWTTVVSFCASSAQLSECQGHTRVLRWDFQLRVFEPCREKGSRRTRPS